ncbi:hypothetical protein MGG_17608 [Pyricularia oryzae 70-15]|uniref:Uncharacterized protein n=1 Tax=Pyricularia oryzae (strain 70-15 / ATCC MYA-4617 / FGSC 8958) TaxID=242507 RepID=G4NG59_PYRO7|nr:uncharacterized protein MGG_17608 [Pyricularia oryzae 70-15]EHA47016.1 hypothetical protein MGG_17608 [Pyricularia oryzae 70-15]
MSIRHLALMPPSTKSSAKLVRGTGFNVAWPPWIGAPMVSCSVTWPGYKLKVWAGSGEETSGRKMHKSPKDALGSSNEWPRSSDTLSVTYLGNTRRCRKGAIVPPCRDNVIEPRG